MSTSVFADYEPDLYEHTHTATLRLDVICGGIPTDPKKVEGWLKTKLADKDDIIQQMVAETMAERGVDADEATDIVAIQQHLNGFKRDDNGLYIEGRQVKAMIKEAANIRWAKERWGATKKGTKSFFAEHVFVPERTISLGVSEPSGIAQRFVHTWRGNGIQYEEYVEGAEITFTVVSDYDFTDEQWAHLWLTAEKQGLGATRSQGYGTFTVVGWDRLMS